MTVEFDALDDGRGIHVRDTAEGEQFTLRTDRAVDPVRAPTDDFTMPVDAAVAVDAGELHLPVLMPPVFWRDGEVVSRADRDSDVERFEPATYEVDFSPPGAKVYVRVCEAAVTARFTDHLSLEVDPSTRLVVGVRSHHETPEATVTTTRDPRDVMAAVSTFGSALKSLTPDRSWPTLRGHPPAVEVGDTLDVPDAVTPPETGVTIGVPPEYGAAYTVAPLAYYLGATVEPASRPHLAAGGREHDFDPTDLAADVRRVLAHVFALDCAVRTVGLHPFRTRMNGELEARVDLDYESLFETPLAERTAAYLDVPLAATDGLVDWHYAADVAPRPEYAAALPYLVGELAVVRCPPPEPRTVDLSPTPDALRAEGRYRAVSSSDGSAPPSQSVVVPRDADTPGQSWVGTVDAVGAANPTVGSFQRALDWPDGDCPLDVHVVYNDTRLRDVDTPRYGDHPFAQTTVRTSHALSTSALRAALSAETDFLHFVGHVTDDGMVCHDGALDTRTLAETGVSAFLLNGCRSSEQGRALLTAGSVGGIVTVDDVADADAGRVGTTAAALLDAGYPLYAVLDALDTVGLQSDRYTILGSGLFALRRTVTGSAVLDVFDSAAFDADTDPIPLTSHYYPRGENGLGSILSLSATTDDRLVHSAAVRRERLPRDALDSYLNYANRPVILDGDVRFTDDLSAADFA